LVTEILLYFALLYFLEKWQIQEILFILNKLRFTCSALLIIVCLLINHLARHTYATTANLNSIPIEEISKAMGHATIQQTKDYIATLPKNCTPENEKMKQKTVPLDIFN